MLWDEGGIGSGSPREGPALKGVDEEHIAAWAERREATTLSRILESVRSRTITLLPIVTFFFLYFFFFFLFLQIICSLFLRYKK